MPRPVLIPHFPGRGTSLPQVLQMHLVAQVINASPESAVPKDGDALFLHPLIERRRFPHFLLLGNIVDGGRLNDKKSAVDPHLHPVSLLFETLDATAGLIEIKCAASSRRLDCGQRNERTLVAVKPDDVRHVHVADAIAIGETKRLIPDQVTKPASTFLRSRCRCRCRLG